MEPIQDDIETVRQALHDFGDDTQVMVDGEAALDRLVAERDRYEKLALDALNDRERLLAERVAWERGLQDKLDSVTGERDRLQSEVEELKRELADRK